MAADQPTGTVVMATWQDQLGRNLVGVMAVFDNPLHAEIVVVTGGNRLPCEATQELLSGQEVVSGQDVFRATVVPGFGNGLGSVSFTPLPQMMVGGRPLPAAAVVLTGGQGGLRVDGPDIRTATDMRVTSFKPDEQRPNSADAEWWPALLGRENTAAADVKAARLTVGEFVVVGHVEAEVLAIEGATVEHSARVIFELKPETHR